MSKIDYILNPKNIMRMDYIEDYVGIKIPKSILFNITQISEKEVIELINTDMIEFDDRVVVLTQKQLKCLADKEAI